MRRASNLHSATTSKWRLRRFGTSQTRTTTLVWRLTEHYDNEVSTIDCRADYSSFREFEVEVKFDLGPVRPGP